VKSNNCTFFSKVLLDVMFNTSLAGLGKMFKPSMLFSLIEALQILTGVWLFLGSGVPVVKSVALSSVSEQPSLFLKAAVVLLKTDIVAVPSYILADPIPTKSITFESVEEVITTSSEVSAILKFVAAILNDSVPMGTKSASKSIVPFEPAANCIRKYSPGCIVTLGRYAFELPKLPADVAYCST